MKTLLYATNCKASTSNALSYAYSLSQKLNATLIVLKVFDLPPYDHAILAKPLENVQKLAKQEQVDIVANFCKEHIGDDLEKMNIRPVARLNQSIIKGILFALKEFQADLLMVGVKGEQSNRGIWASDIAKKLISKASTPVMVIPEYPFRESIQKILYASDYEEMDITGIRRLIPLARAFDAWIHIVHISEEGEYAATEQMEWFKQILQERVDYDKIKYEIVNSEALFYTLIMQIIENDADIIAMLERNETSFFKGIFHQDLVKKMEDHLMTPLISFNKNII